MFGLISTRFVQDPALKNLLKRMESPNHPNTAPTDMIRIHEFVMRLRNCAKMPHVNVIQWCSIDTITLLLDDVEQFSTMLERFFHPIVTINGFVKELRVFGFDVRLASANNPSTLTCTHANLSNRSDFRQLQSIQPTIRTFTKFSFHNDPVVANALWRYEDGYYEIDGTHLAISLPYSGNYFMPAAEHKVADTPDHGLAQGVSEGAFSTTECETEDGGLTAKENGLFSANTFLCALNNLLYASEHNIDLFWDQDGKSLNVFLSHDLAGVTLVRIFGPSIYRLPVEQQFGLFCRCIEGSGFQRFTGSPLEASRQNCTAPFIQFRHTIYDETVMRRAGLLAPKSSAQPAEIMLHASCETAAPSQSVMHTQADYEAATALVSLAQAKLVPVQLQKIMASNM